MKRRNIIAAMPLAIFGLTASAKGNLPPSGFISTNKGVLDERELLYVLEHVSEASTVDMSCTFVAFAQHLSKLASAGDCESIHAVAERLLNHLYELRNFYNETRERWLAEEVDHLAECVDMDDENVSDDVRDMASKKFDERHVRRGCEV